MRDGMHDERRYQILKDLFRTARPMTAEEKRIQAISWAAGQCCLSDCLERSLEWWMRVAEAEYDKIHPRT